MNTTSGWQPIETAPKDGTRFIAWHPKGYVDFFHWQDYGPEFSSPVGFRDSFIVVFTGENGPKYWMRLPEPPKANQP